MLHGTAPSSASLSRSGLPTGLTREYLLHHRVCPLDVASDGTLHVAAAPGAWLEDAVHDLRTVYGRPVVVTDATQSDVDRLIERITAHEASDLDAPLIDAQASADDEAATDVRDLVNQPPVVRYVNLLLREAHDAGASDIHIEAARHGLSARLRIDGVLVPAAAPPAAIARAVVSRIKLLANLDIAERRRPQDGRLRVRLESRELDLRASTVPTLFGESLVLRLLDRGGRPVSLPDLGMPSDVLRLVETLTARPHGMVLVTGPTGSGKTTTLYAALQQRDTTAEKILTVEDPVEYELPGITQVPVHRQAGVTFAAALRSILRQDPDVVMLGEMRDPETAEVAVQAAMTGHLVLSTLHTNDAVGAVPRLIDLGVPPYLLAATVEGILAQRLVRVVCRSCRVCCPPDRYPALGVFDRSVGDVDRQEAPDARNTDDQGQVFMAGPGCPDCRHTGYRGRVGLFELVVLTDGLRDAITTGAARSTLHAIARRDGMRSLAADGWAKVGAGVTTVEEVLRVVQN
jgi:general secretion pathway protein E